MQLPPSHATGAARARPRRWRLAVAVGIVAAMAAPLGAHAQVDEPQRTADASNSGGYVTTTAPSERSIEVSGFRPVCIGNAPFISYTIVPVGFAPVDQSATLVIRSADGNEVGTETVESFTGQIIWPGASIDQAGNATDWPGWRRADDGGSWEPDPTDDLLRDGLTIEVIVDGAPPAIATVEYPPDDSACANPRIPPMPNTTPTTTTCVPGQSNDENPADDCELATAGSDPSNLVLIGATILFAGLAAFAATRRRGVPAPGAD